VSAEGTAAGVVAALAMATMALLLGQTDVTGAVCVTLASVVANILESVLGASVQGRISWLSNDVVNVLQISVAAGLAVVLNMVS
jgi:uncharacterized membrane protein